MELFHARRMLQHADFMETVPNEKLNLGVFWDAEDQLGLDWQTEATMNSCGTQACVLGWAGFNPAFKDLGLKTYEDCGNSDEPQVRFTPRTAVDITYCENRKFEEHQDWGELIQGALFFGLTYGEARTLFGGNEFVYNDEDCPTGKDVAEKLRSFVYERFPELETK